MEFDTEFATAVLQNQEQLFALKTAEPVANRADDLATDVSVDRVPMGKVLAYRGKGHRIGSLKIAERGIGKDDAETERVIGSIALVDDNLMTFVGKFEQDAEIQARRAASDASDTHFRPAYDRLPLGGI